MKAKNYLIILVWSNLEDSSEYEIHEYNRQSSSRSNSVDQIDKGGTEDTLICGNSIYI